MMRFVFKEILPRGRKKLFFQEATGITPKHKLPLKYIERRDHPRVLQNKNSKEILFITPPSHVEKMVIGDSYDEAHVERCMETAERVGEWLKEVLDEIRELKKTWNKTKEYKI